MPITIETFDECLGLVRGWISSEFGGDDLSDDGYHGKWARVLALHLWSLKANVQDADADWPPSSSSSSAALDDAAELFAVPNGAGGVGRKGARVATGGLGTITGTKGTVYAIGSQLLGPDRVTLFELTAGVTIPGTPPGTDVAAGTFSALTAGAAGNLLVGAKLQWVTPPAGNVGPVTVTQAFAGGSDVESDADLLARIFEQMANGLRITPGDLRSIAEGIQGIARAYVYPRRSGTGSADVVVTQSGTGKVRAEVTTDALDAVQADLDAKRNVGIESVTAMRSSSTSSGHAVEAHATPSTLYPWDWTGAYAGTVADYDGSFSLVVTDAMPADFQAAVAAGKKPRIQIASVGQNSGVPQMAACTAYNNGTKTLTLAAYSTAAASAFPNPSVIAGGDGVYPGSAFAVVCAEAIVSYVDTLGPSKASGFADESSGAWDDTLRVDQIRRVVLDQSDASGNRYVTEFAASPTIDGFTADVQATDPGSAPRLLYLTIALVIP